MNTSSTGWQQRQEKDILETWADTADTIPMSSSADFFRRPRPAPRRCQTPGAAAPATRPMPDQLRIAALDYLTQTRRKGLGAEVAARHGVTQWEMLGAVQAEVTRLGAFGVQEAREMLGATAREEKPMSAETMSECNACNQKRVIVRHGYCRQCWAEKTNPKSAEGNGGAAAEKHDTPLTPKVRPAASSAEAMLEKVAAMLRPLALEDLEDCPPAAARAAADLVIEMAAARRARAEA